MISMIYIIMSLLLLQKCFMYKGRSAYTNQYCVLTLWCKILTLFYVLQ